MLVLACSALELDIAALLSVVRRVALGGRAIDADVVAALVEAREHASARAQLTDRERQILGLMAEGLTNAGIARRLCSQNAPSTAT